MTPTKLPQVYIELPNIGISSLLAANSKDIVTTPATRTKVVRIKENPLLLEIMKISLLHYSRYLFSLAIE